MPAVHRSTLLDFLKTPRIMGDVAQEFGISPELARYHLRKAMKSGQVLASDGRFRVRALGERFKVARTDSHMPSITRRLLGNTGPTIGASVAEVKFSRRGLNLRGKNAKSVDVGLHRLSATRVKRLTGHLSRRSKKASTHSASKRDGWLLKPKHRAGKPPAQHTLQNLYDELHVGSLTLTEITCKFDLSKQSVRRLVKRGLLLEEWGQGGIGIRYKLSETGLRQLSAMQASSRVSAHEREVFLPLRSRAPL